MHHLRILGDFCFHDEHCGLKIIIKKYDNFVLFIDYCCKIKITKIRNTTTVAFQCKSEYLRKIILEIFYITTVKLQY